MTDSLADKIKEWRRRNFLSQKEFAHHMNVSQQAISRWENGTDNPSAKMRAQLRDLMSAVDDITIEKSFISDQSTIRALIDTDGGRLIGFSKGFEAMWPDFSILVGTYLEDKIINELQSIITTHEYKKQIIDREIVIATGVSLKHIDLDVDLPIKHSWHICFRKIGSKTIADMIFEPCDEKTSLGVKKILRISDLK